MKYISILMLVCIGSISPLLGQSQLINPDVYYRLTTRWQGSGKSLDIVNDGTNNKIQLANTGNYSSQFWKFTRLKGEYYRLTTRWQGDRKSLDIVHNGKNNQLQLANTGNVSGQYWKVTPLSDGYVRLTTQWQGEAKSLDVVNDGKNNQLQLAKSGSFLGQYWKLTELGPILSTTNKLLPMEQRCYKLVQGKVAWSRKGHKTWQDNNVRKLCAGTTNPQNTIDCFKQGIVRHGSWNEAIAECLQHRTSGKSAPMEQGVTN